MASPRRNHWLTAFLFLALGSCFACADSKDSEPGAGSGGAAGTTGSGGQTSCPAAATSCPSGCELISGSAIDPVQKCLGKSQTIGCWVGTGGNNAQYGCVKSKADGTSYQTPSTSYQSVLYGSGEWAPCAADWMSTSGPCL